MWIPTYKIYYKYNSITGPYQFLPFLFILLANSKAVNVVLASEMNEMGVEIGASKCFLLLIYIYYILYRDENYFSFRIQLIGATWVKGKWEHHQLERKKRLGPIASFLWIHFPWSTSMKLMAFGLDQWKIDIHY